MSETISLNTDTENQSLRKIEKDSSLSLGQYGAVYKADAAALTGGPWGSIQATAAAVVSLTASNWTGDATTAVDIPAGATIFGNFTAITLTSGKIIAYKQSS
jgi:hypothetical protein